MRNNILSEQHIEQEWSLVQAAQQDASKFEPLYDKYYENVFRFIYRRTGDESLSADICSQVFYKALQNLSKYVNRGVPFSAWLFRIASNEVSQFFRNQSKHRVVSLDKHSAHTLLTEVQHTEDEDTGLPDVKQMLKALDELGETDISLIEMRFFEQRSFKEIADILYMTESNAKVRTYRLLEKLRKHLTGEKKIKKRKT